MIALAKQHDLNDANINLFQRRDAEFAEKGKAEHPVVSYLLLRPDEVESCRHTGEGRYPVSESNRRLDPGLRRGDEFKHHRAGAIGTGHFKTMTNTHRNEYSNLTVFGRT